MVGDGMGVSQVSAAQTVKGKLQMSRLKTMGLLTTHCSNTFITDSAAAGTALATGFKTSKGTISQTPEGEKLKTMLEYAEEAGKSTGIVVTCSVTHATPAAFMTHAENRGEQNLIAEQIVKSGVDVLFGGGKGYFIAKSEKDSKRKDEKNLIAELEEQMPVVTDAKNFQALENHKQATALLDNGHLPVAEKRPVSLQKMTETAIKILAKNPRGFFLMVEGSQIDWGGHQNNSQTIISETIDFDNAVGTAMDFAEKNGKTLVIVTADHETGGYSLLNGSVKEHKVSATKFTTGGHSGVMIPVFSYGPGSTEFGGLGDNTKVGKLLIQYLQTRQNKF
jgi:alkaline phosphatase